MTATGSAAAVELPADPATGQEAIAVTPPVLEEEVSPGTRGEVTVQVQNQMRRAFAFTTEFRDLQAGHGSNANAEVVEAGSSKYSAAAWMSIAPAAWTLKSATTQELTLAFDVPRSAGGGGRYAALLIRAVPVEGTGNVQLTTEIPVYVLLKVSGKQRRNLDVDVIAPSSPRWRGGQATWEVRFTNRGDVHENVSGQLNFEGLFSSVEPRRLDPFILLPGGERRQEFKIDLRDAPDVWTASAHVDRGAGERPVATSERVLVLPWWLLAVLVVAISLVVWKLRRRRRWREDEPEEDESSEDDRPELP